MSGTIGKIVKIVGIVALAVTTAGVGLGIAGGFSLAASLGAVAGTFGISAGVLAGIDLIGLAALTSKSPKASAAQTDRLLTSLVTDTPRTIFFGNTALGTDIRYEEWWGHSQEYFSEVLLTAGHWCTSIDQIWIESELAWTATGGTQGRFVGYFWAVTHVRATSASIYHNDWSNRWGGNAAFTGCSTAYLQFKVTGNSSKASSPFSSSVPTRITLRGQAAPVYDPRFDDTRGGSGPMRVDDQSTWAFNHSGVEIGRNPALCLLFYLLGWRIQNPVTNSWKLSVGRGVPVDRIDFDSFITAANQCDELVTKGDGTQEPRYRCDGGFTEGDSPKTVIGAFEATMNGKLRDWGGKLALQLFHDDLALPVVHFTEDDILGAVDWDAGSDIPKNVVKGKYVDASDSSLYQSVDYPAVSLPSLDGIDRFDPFDTPLSQSPDQSQRLAKMRAERSQYPGSFSAVFNAKAWGVKDGDPVTLTFSRLGFDTKTFRVDLTTVDQTGACPMRLIEESSALYAAFSDTRAVVTPAVPTTFDPLMLPIPLAIADAAGTSTWEGTTGPGKSDDNATVGAPIGTPVADRLAEQVVSDLDVNAAGIISQGLRQDDAQTALDARTFINGQPVSTVLLNFQNAQTTTNTALQSNFNLLGAKTADGTGWVLNGATVQIGAGTTLAQKFEQIGTATGALSTSVSNLQTALINPDGSGEAKAVLSVTSGGVVTGYSATSDGSTGSFAILASRFSVVDDSTGTAVTPFLITGGVVYAPNLVVSNLTVNTAVVPGRAAATADIQGTGGGSSVSGLPALMTVLTVVVHMPVAGWIEVLGGAKQNFTGGQASSPWAFGATVNGAALPEATPSGTVPGDSVVVQGAYYASTPGDYTVNLLWNATSSIQLQGRSLFVKGYTNTQ